MKEEDAKVRDDEAETSDKDTDNKRVQKPKQVLVVSKEVKTSCKAAADH